MYRSIASHQPGVISKVGLNTFVDPRIEGGKVNSITKQDIVEVISLHNQDFLFYTFPRNIDVAFIRGTTADPEGYFFPTFALFPISQERYNGKGSVNIRCATNGNCC